jgi:hypothetical protein
MRIPELSFLRYRKNFHLHSPYVTKPRFKSLLPQRPPVSEGRSSVLEATVLGQDIPKHFANNPY